MKKLKSDDVSSPSSSERIVEEYYWSFYLNIGRCFLVEYTGNNTLNSSLKLIVL